VYSSLAKFVHKVFLIFFSIHCRMQWVYLLTTFAVAFCYPALPCLNQDGYCTPHLQCTIKEPNDCINGHFKPNASDCGCCPACIKYLGECCSPLVLRSCLNIVSTAVTLIFSGVVGKTFKHYPKYLK
jgi:hypothetical protein